MMEADNSAFRLTSDTVEKWVSMKIQLTIMEADNSAHRVKIDHFKDMKSPQITYQINNRKTFKKKFKEWKSLLSEHGLKESTYLVNLILRGIIVKLQNLTIRYERCQDSNKYKSNESDVLMTIRRQIRILYWLSNVTDKLSEDENQNLIGNVKEEIKNLEKRWIKIEDIMLGIGPCVPSAYLTTRQEHKHAKVQVIWRKMMTITDEEMYEAKYRKCSLVNSRILDSWTNSEFHQSLLQLKKKTSYDWKNMKDNTTIDENKHQHTVNNHVHNSLGFNGNKKVTFRNPCSKDMSTTKLLNCDMIEFIGKDKQKSENKHCMETGEMPVNKHSEMSGDKRNIKCSIPKLKEAFEQGCKRIYGYNWKFILFAAILCMNVFSGHCSFNCTNSRQTSLTVDKCPENETAWIAAATKKDCSAVHQTCTSKENFVYHCLLDTEENTLIEVCAVRQIFFRSCPYFNDYGATLESRKQQHCNTCKQYYYSNEVYKHQECYKTPMAITMEPLSQTYVVANSEQTSNQGVTTVPTLRRPMHITLAAISFGFLVVIIFRIMLFWRSRRHGMRSTGV